MNESILLHAATEMYLQNYRRIKTLITYLLSFGLFLFFFFLLHKIQFDIRNAIRRGCVCVIIFVRSRQWDHTTAAS